MIKNFTRLLLFFALAAGMAACASGIKSYQKGNYLTACEQAVSKLRSHPDNQDARYALTNAYPLALTNAEREIGNLLMSMNSANAGKIVASYERLNKLANDINHCPAALEIISHPNEYYNELRSAKNTAAGLCYNEGMAALDRRNIEDARYALDRFTAANHYVPGYKDVLDKIEEARYESTLRVIVMNPQLPNRYQLNADFFYTRLMQDVARNTYRHLVRFYTPAEAASLQMNDPHQLLVLNFEDFTVGNTDKSSNTVELKREDVLVGTTVINGKQQNIYGTVKANYTYSKLEVISGGVLSIRLVDPLTKRIINQKNLQGSTVWKSEWASYNGDERALSDHQKQLTTKRQQSIPPQQELFSSFAGPLYNDAMKFISSVY